MGLENVAQDCGLDLENRAQNRIFLGGLCCIFFGVMYPLSFFFFRWWVGYYFFRENRGVHITQCLKFFPRSFGTVTQQQYVCVQQQYITFFWLSVPLFGGSGAFQFPSDALFNHHSSTKLGGCGIKLISATLPFLDMFFQLWLKDFSVGFLIFLMMGLGTCFYFFSSSQFVYLVSQYKKLNQSRQSFFFLLFLKSYFPFFKRQASILCVLGEIVTLFYRKDYRITKEKSISYLKSSVTSISDRKKYQFGQICLNLLLIMHLDIQKIL